MAENTSGLSKRQELDLLRTTLEQERSTFIPSWRDTADYVLPRRPQFTVTDTNKGDRRNLKIIDSTATLAARTLRSGMMSGVTSPARPWFRLTTPDPTMSEIGEIKDWLHIVTQRMTTVFLRSNLYNILPISYGDLGVFGTSAIGIEEDFDDVVRFFVFPIGSYCIATDDRQKVDVFTREFRLTVRQLVLKFGGDEPDWSKFSIHVKNLYDKKQHDAWIDVYHIIRRNPDFNPKQIASKKYESIYYEKGNGTDKPDTYLREAGYDYFPILAPRWEVTGEDVYATEYPAITAIGDIKALQLMEKRKAQAVEKMINPPMIAPSHMNKQKASILPGDITYADDREGQKGFRPAHEVRLSLNELREDVNQHRQRIRRAFYEDLFLMLASSDRREITAREIDERHEEKLLALGAVLEQLNQDLLDPLIDITFNIMNAQGQIPEPPQELQGQPLKVEYISIMHQAQKMAGLAGIERTTSFIGQVAQFKPDVLDKVDTDQLIDEYAEITGVPPRIIVPDDKVAAIREGRAAQAQGQRTMEALQQGAGIAKDLSGADLEGNNALSALLKQSQAGNVMGAQ